MLKIQQHIGSNAVAIATEVRCAHCGSVMKKVVLPPYTHPASPYTYVCFNDECSFYRDNFEHTNDRFISITSNRYEFDPFTGMCGPMAVWSQNALRNYIVEE